MFVTLSLSYTMLLMISDNSLCPLLCASVSKVFSVTEAAARVASGHKYKGTSSRITITKKLAQEIQIQIQKNTTTNPEIQNH